jgi:hypothetical protein
VDNFTEERGVRFYYHPLFCTCCDSSILSLTVRLLEANLELREHDQQHVLHAILADINANQDDYMANRLDGFRIDRCGVDLVRVQRMDNGRLLDSCFLSFL